MNGRLRAALVRPPSAVTLVLFLFLCFVGSALFVRLRRVEDKLTALTEALATRPQPPARPKTISISDAPLLGPRDAKIVVVLYSDFQCPYCRTFATETLPKLKEEYLGPRPVALAFRHLPINAIHPHATGLAEAAECASRQNQFWPFHDRLFHRPTAPDPGSVTAEAQAVGMNMAAFKQCQEGQASARIKSDLDSAAEMGITGTPAFVFGLAESQDIRVLRIQMGTLPISILRTILDGLLVRAK